MESREKEEQILENKSLVQADGDTTILVHDLKSDSDDEKVVKEEEIKENKSL